MSDTDPALITLLPPVITGVFGILVGHYLTKDRDAQARKAILDRESEIRRREFRRIIARYRSRIERPSTPDHAPEEPWPVFNMALTEIIAESAMCEKDFADRKTLDDAIRRATELHQEEAYARARQRDGDFRKVLAEELTQILNAAK